MLVDLKWRLRTALAVLRKGRPALESQEVRWYQLPYGKDFEEDVEVLRRLAGHPSWTETIYLAVSGLKFIVAEMLDGRPVYIRRGDAFLPVRVKSYDGLLKGTTDGEESSADKPEVFACH